VGIFESIAIDMSVRNAEEATPLLVATKHNNTALFPVLLELSKPDIQDNLGYTALCYAIINNNNQMIIALLNEGTHYIVAGVQNDTILHIAARYGETETLEVLWKSNLQGLDYNTMDTLGKTAMDIADERLDASHEWIDAFNLLIGSI
jgi:ankyrin repeat protein